MTPNQRRQRTADRLELPPRFGIACVARERCHGVHGAERRRVAFSAEALDSVEVQVQLRPMVWPAAELMEQLDGRLTRCLGHELHVYNGRREYVRRRTRSNCLANIVQHC